MKKPFPVEQMSSISLAVEGGVHAKPFTHRGTLESCWWSCHPLLPRTRIGKSSLCSTVFTAIMRAWRKGLGTSEFNKGWAAHSKEKRLPFRSGLPHPTKLRSTPPMAGSVRRRYVIPAAAAAHLPQAFSWWEEAFWTKLRAPRTTLLKG